MPTSDRDADVSVSTNFTSSVIPTWTNLPGDGGFWVHARTVEDFMTYAVEPSFVAIEERIDSLVARREGGWQFEESDLEDLRVETSKAFALSLQSFWERQFRAWITRANDQLSVVAPDVVLRADWAGLQKIFKQLRGLDVARIGRWDELEMLNLIGSACRHGEGSAAETLRKRYPELWSGPQEDIRIELSLLRKLASAIMDFWAAAEDIYNNSIQRKHPSTVKGLVQAETRWRNRLS